MGTTITASRVLALLAGAAIALTACSSTTPGTPQGAPASAGNQSPAVTTAPAAATTPDLGSAGDKQFCQAALNLGKDALGGANNITDAEGLKKVVDVWSKLAAIAPAEIKGDVTQIATAFQNATSNPNADPQQLLAAMQGPLQHYAAWGATHCAGVN